MERMKIDVLVCTYNSEKYLDSCLSGIERSFPVNRILIVDHHSKDKTLPISRKHNTEIFLENSGRAYALNLGISKVETEIFAIIDSDVVLEKGKWVNEMINKFEHNPRLGGIGLCMFSNEPLWRQKYAAYYQHVRSFRDIKGGTWVNAYVIRKKALGPKFRIPEYLNSFEHVYLKDAIIKNSYEIDSVDAEGTHFYDWPKNKGYWMGAGQRSYEGLNGFARIVVRQFFLSPIKALMPALAFRDANIIVGNTTYWTQFLIGYLNPAKYLHMKRS